MRGLPKLLTLAEEIAPDGSARTIGHQDLTETFLLLACSGRVDVGDLDRAVSLEAELSSGLSSRARRCANESRLRLPNLAQDARRFVRAVGGPDRLEDYRERIAAIGSFHRRLIEADRTLDRVRRATLLPFGTKARRFHAPGNDPEFVRTAEEAYASIEWDAYVKAHPRPPRQDTAEYRRWANGMRDFPKVGPLHVYATIEARWTGLDLDGTRRVLAESRAANPGKRFNASPYHVGPGDFAFDFAAYVEGQLYGHPDRAVHQLVDVEFLRGCLGRWYPHAGTGSHEETEAMREIQVWCTLQDIVTCKPDFGRIQAIYGHTKEEIVERCERDLLAVREALEAARVWDGRARVDAVVSGP